MLLKPGFLAYETITSLTSRTLGLEEATVDNVLGAAASTLAPRIDRDAVVL